MFNAGHDVFLGSYRAEILSITKFPVALCLASQLTQMG
jgi:hypothetical protein